MITHPLDYKPTIILGTTQQCNYRCRMCCWSRPEIAKQLAENDTTMSMDLFEKALSDVAPYCSSICLAGSGEFLSDPLINERLQVLGKTLRDYKDVRFFQTTNASLLSADKLYFLKGAHKVGFNISIDSVDALVYASIRIPGKLSVVMENVRALRMNLKDVGIEDVHLQLNMVMLKRNIFSIPDVLHFAKEVHASLFVDHPQGFGPEDLFQESLFNLPVFANAFLNKCQELADSLNVPFLRPPPFAVLPNEIEEYYNAIKQKNLFCYQLNTSGPLQILPDGKVLVCCQNLSFGNLNEKSFEEIFYSPLYDEYRQAIADGTPLSPCDHCRWLYRSAPFLYESSVYDMDIPPESRNYDLEPDFAKEGFYDWLNELSEKQIRAHLINDYASKAYSAYRHGIENVAAASRRDNEKISKIIELIQQDVSMAVYPSGRQSAWMLNNSSLSKAKILGFSDKNPALHNTLFHGYKVCPPQDIPELKPDVLLIISDLYHEQICKELSFLESAGITIVTL